jgi:hypothetical protein
VSEQPETPVTVPPFGATVAGVRALIPDAPIPEQLATGVKGVDAGMVRGWLRELSGRVDRRLAGWRGLRLERNAEETAEDAPSPREALIETAAGLVHTAAASYTEDARFPTRAEQNDSRYGAVLWRRFEAGLAELDGWLRDQLDEGDEGDLEPEAAAADAPAYSFPLPAFPDGFRV